MGNAKLFRHVLFVAQTKKGPVCRQDRLLGPSPPLGCREFDNAHSRSRRSLVCRVVPRKVDCLYVVLLPRAKRIGQGDCRTLAIFSAQGGDIDFVDLTDKNSTARPVRADS